MILAFIQILTLNGKYSGHIRSSNGTVSTLTASLMTSGSSIYVSSTENYRLDFGDSVSLYSVGNGEELICTMTAETSDNTLTLFGVKEDFILSILVYDTTKVSVLYQGYDPNSTVMISASAPEFGSIPIIHLGPVAVGFGISMSCYLTAYTFSRLRMRKSSVVYSTGTPSLAVTPRC